MGTAPLTTAWEVLRIISLTNMNKFLATLLFAAAVSAEADPYLLGYHGLGNAAYPGYAGHGYALPYAAAGYFSSVSPSASLTTLGAAPAAIPAVGGAYASLGYAGYGYGLAGYGSYSPSAGVSIA